MAKNLTKAQKRLLEQKREEQRLNDQLIDDAKELVDLSGKLTTEQQKHLKNLEKDKTLRTETVSLEKNLTSTLFTGRPSSSHSFTKKFLNFIYSPFKNTKTQKNIKLTFLSINFFKIFFLIEKKTISLYEM